MPPSRLPRFRRLRGSAVARSTKAVWVCARPDCEVHNKPSKNPLTGKLEKPATCIACGGMAFDYFQTTGEAARWAELRLQEKIGAINGLRRQVRFPLYTIDPNNMKVEVAIYVADFVWLEEGREIVEDYKPRGGVDPLAALKLKWMAAQRGVPVSIYTHH